MRSLGATGPTRLAALAHEGRVASGCAAAGGVGAGAVLVEQAETNPIPDTNNAE
jgi:hypothetical protein